jgi:hypothetical protein
VFVEVENNHITGSSRSWRVNVGTSLPHTVFDEVERIVTERNDVRANVVRRLLLRGLEAYKRDGQLDETQQPEEVQRNRTNT